MGENKAITHFKKIGEKYKAEIIESIPANEELSIYHHGDTWYDLCRGPYLASSGKIGKALNSQKYLELIGAETQKMKCYKGYMELAGIQKRPR